MPMTEIQGSSSLTAYDYDADHQVLSIQFVGGKTYRYHGASHELVNDFLAAESLGSFFARCIKAKLRCLHADQVDPLPEVCAAYHEGKVVMIYRDGGFIEVVNQEEINPRAWNEERGISAAQVVAMLAGSLKGWASKGTNPSQYDETTAISRVYLA